MPASHYIYHVIDSAGAVRYVGCSPNPDGRLHQHLHMAVCRARHGFTPGARFYKWIWSEMANGRIPTMRVIAEAGERWRVTERDEIRRRLGSGAPLLNVQAAGMPELRVARGPREPAIPEPTVFRVARGIGLKLRNPTTGKRYHPELGERHLGHVLDALGLDIKRRVGK